MKLDFDDDPATGGCNCTLPEEVATYRGYTIRAVYDRDPPNPLKEWDCEPPILVYDGDRLTGYGMDETVPVLTEAEIRRNARAIASELRAGQEPQWRAGDTPLACQERLREWRKSSAGTLLRAIGDLRHDADSATDALNNALSEYARALSHADKLELLRQVYEWKGILAICVARTGYVQAQWRTVLAVATPEWIEKIGAPGAGAPPKSFQRQLEGAADLYAAWSYGDVFGFIVEDPEGARVESIWGYYGRDHEESGLADAAREVIDHAIEKLRRARMRRIKDWIRNRVPLGMRAMEASDA